jgi:hypothetical protein
MATGLSCSAVYFLRKICMDLRGRRHFQARQPAKLSSGCDVFLQGTRTWYIRTVSLQMQRGLLTGCCDVTPQRRMRDRSSRSMLCYDQERNVQITADDQFTLMKLCEDRLLFIGIHNSRFRRVSSSSFKVLRLNSKHFLHKFSSVKTVSVRSPPSEPGLYHVSTLCTETRHDYVDTSQKIITYYTYIHTCNRLKWLK